jgi:hypothetical protein
MAQRFHLTVGFTEFASVDAVYWALFEQRSSNRSVVRWGMTIPLIGRDKKRIPLLFSDHD